MFRRLSIKVMIVVGGHIFGAALDRREVIEQAKYGILAAAFQTIGSLARRGSFSTIAWRT
jgi:hypothetical protein